MNLMIREIEPLEYELLEPFLYEAVFQPDPNNLIPREVTQTPEAKNYYEDFGRPHDRALLAEVDGQVVGAVWTRIIDGPVKGFGYIDEKTPEFAISLLEAYRGKGIGTKLMQDMLDLLRRDGYARTALSVQKANYAVRMYRAVGFEIVEEREDDYLMVCTL